MNGEAEPADLWEELVERLLALPEGGGLSPLSAGILAALDLDLARDSRTFARVFGIAHALVLRECITLAEDADLITIARRDPRTQRLFPDLTDHGRALLAAAGRNG